jgi:hypothetical protein
MKPLIIQISVAFYCFIPPGSKSQGELIIQNLSWFAVNRPTVASIQTGQVAIFRLVMSRHFQACDGGL